VKVSPTVKVREEEPRRMMVGGVVSGGIVTGGVTTTGGNNEPAVLFKTGGLVQKSGTIPCFMSEVRAR
jgi:hypothetical protein